MRMSFFRAKGSKDLNKTKGVGWTRASNLDNQVTQRSRVWGSPEKWDHNFKWYNSQGNKKMLLGRNTMTNIDSVLKHRDISLPVKVYIVKASVFLVVMYGPESWTTEKAECWRTDAFELWCWRRLLRVSWTARWSSQSILKETNTEYSLEGLLLKLKL